MNPTLKSRATGLPSPQELSALLTLLADDDPRVHQVIRGKILAFGDRARELLAPHQLSPDAVLRRRVNEILNHLARQQTDNDFLTYCLTQKENPDLERGVWLLARTRYPDINLEGYQALIDNYSLELQEWIDFGGTEMEILDAINVYLFRHLHYRGNDEDYYHPENSYLNRVMDQRTGNPISLSTIYLMVARRLHLPVTGIGLPGHFLCRYQSSTQELFIDPFNRGRLLSRRDCVTMMQNSGVDLTLTLIRPTRSADMLRRMCANLYHIHRRNGPEEEARRFNRYLVALRV